MIIMIIIAWQSQHQVIECLTFGVKVDLSIACLHVCQEGSACRLACRAPGLGSEFRLRSIKFVSITEP